MSLIKQVSTFKDGKWSTPIAIGVEAKNVVMDETHKLSDVLGDFDTSKGSLSEQINIISQKVDDTKTDIDDSVKKQINTLSNKVDDNAEAINNIGDTVVVKNGGEIDNTVLKTAPDTTKYPIISNAGLADEALVPKAGDTEATLWSKFNALRGRLAAFDSMSVSKEVLTFNTMSSATTTTIDDGSTRLIL